MKTPYSKHMERERALDRLRREEDRENQALLPRLVELAIIREHLAERYKEDKGFEELLLAYDTAWNRLASSTRESNGTLDWLKVKLAGGLSPEWIAKWRSASKYMDFQLERALTGIGIRKPKD